MYEREVPNREEYAILMQAGALRTLDTALAYCRRMERGAPGSRRSLAQSGPFLFSQ